MNNTDLLLDRIDFNRLSYLINKTCGYGEGSLTRYFSNHDFYLDITIPDYFDIIVKRDGSLLINTYNRYQFPDFEKLCLFFEETIWETEVKDEMINHIDSLKTKLKNILTFVYES